MPVEVPEPLKASLSEYPRCDRRTERAPGITERCALTSEWAVRCNTCSGTAFLCEGHSAAIADRQTVVRCPACGTAGIVPLRWTFIHLRCGS